MFGSSPFVVGIVFIFNKNERRSTSVDPEFFVRKTIDICEYLW